MHVKSESSKRPLNVFVAGIVSCATMLGLCGRATANPVDLPSKWSQPICTNANGQIFGLDRLSQKPQPGTTPGQILADDFIAGAPPIIGVRWWGSYIDVSNQLPDTKIDFQVSIHASNGNAANHPFSLPTTVLAVYPAVHAFQTFVGRDKAFEAVYRYEALLPTPFTQIQGQEYFISIEKLFDTFSPGRWGWHDACDHRFDYAAVTQSKFGPWTTYTVPQPDPNGLLHTDLAFELLVPEPGTAAMMFLPLLGLVARRRR